MLAGAAITAVLILIGEYAIAFYLGKSALGHRYGAAGGAMAVLLWLYYAAQVFLLGAEITKVWSAHRACPATADALEQAA